MDEQTNLPYRSTNPGKMHACGHDGHTAMLLGAAKYLAETRNFSGTAVVIFQPAEEGGGGGREMVKDGMMERFGIEEVYGMHNMPGLPVGEFAIRPGPLLAAADRIVIEIEGLGSHAARPHQGIDPVVVGAQIVNQAQSIVSRSVDPIKSGLISICQFHAGSADNVIPQTATLRGTARSLLPEVRDIAGKPPARDRGGHRQGLRREGDAHLQSPLSGDAQPREQTEFAAAIASDVAGATGRRYRHAAADGRRGLLLHAGSAPRRVHLHRQWRQRRPAPPGLRLQRRCDPGRARPTGRGWSRPRCRL